jgi:hypothetical protein
MQATAYLVSEGVHLDKNTEKRRKAKSATWTRSSSLGRAYPHRQQRR